MESAAPQRRHDKRRFADAQTRRANDQGWSSQSALRSKAPSSCLQLLMEKEARGSHMSNVCPRDQRMGVNNAFAKNCAPVKMQEILLVPPQSVQRRFNAALSQPDLPALATLAELTNVVDIVDLGALQEAVTTNSLAVCPIEFGASVTGGGSRLACRALAALFILLLAVAGTAGYAYAHMTLDKFMLCHTYKAYLSSAFTYVTSAGHINPCEIAKGNVARMSTFINGLTGVTVGGLYSKASQIYDAFEQAGPGCRRAAEPATATGGAQRRTSRRR